MSSTSRKPRRFSTRSEDWSGLDWIGLKRSRLDREGEMDMEVNMKGMDINSLWRGTIKTG
jgi:hypothetical protein